MPKVIELDPWLAHLERHIPVARAGADPEGAHQMRVAIARLRVWLALGEKGDASRTSLDDDLRWLRNSIARIRDLDVQMQQDPPSSVEAALRRRRAAALRELRATLDEPRVHTLLDALSKLQPISAATAKEALPEMARRVLRRARKAHATRTDDEERLRHHHERKHDDDLAALHRVRCAVRRLRFALEWLGMKAVIADIVEVQDAIGKACDASIALGAVTKDTDDDDDDHTRAYRAKLQHSLRRAEHDARATFRRVEPALLKLAAKKS